MVILFDGICNLCNSSVLFVIRQDTQQKFKFASLQSAYGQQQMQDFQLPAGELSTVLLIKNGKLYQKSNAALEIARNLSGLWPIFYVFKVIPPFIRDGIYNWIARNRYRWFGQKNECMIPTPELKARFIE